MPEEPSPTRSDAERMTSQHVRRAIGNDRESVAWIVARVTPLLLCQARQRIPPSLRRHCDPEDLVAEVWMRVLPCLPRLEPAEGSVRLGLIRLAGTTLIRRIRDLLEKHVLGKPPVKGLPGPGGAGTEIPDATRGVVTHVVAEENKGQVWAGLSALSSRDREILVLRGIEGRSHGEISSLVGLTPEHCAVRYHRALKQLRGQIPSSVLDDLED